MFTYIYWFCFMPPDSTCLINQVVLYKVRSDGQNRTFLFFSVMGLSLECGFQLSGFQGICFNMINKFF